MLSLEEFKNDAISIDGLKSLVGGADEDTEGGMRAFGKSAPSQCDIDNGDGTYDHYYGDEGWITFDAPGNGGG